MDEIDNIINFTKAVRESTLKRLLSILEGYENWNTSEGKMSIAEIIKHLIDSDEWMMEKINNHSLESIGGNAGFLTVKSRKKYLELIEELKRSLNNKIKFIRNLSLNDLEKKIFDDRFGKEVSVWWIIMRGNIDHEIHHRGQISAYLQMINLEL